MILESPLGDEERHMVDKFNADHDAGEKKDGYNYQVNFEDVKVPLCWKEAQHLEDIMFKTFFQLRFNTESQRDEAMATTQRSLKQLASACDKIAASMPKKEAQHEQKH